VDYRQHLSLALASLAAGSEGEAREEMDRALRAAQSVDPDGPRVAEVLGMASMVHEQAGRDAEAIEAGAKAFAIWQRHPGEAADFAAACRRLEGLCARFGDREGAGFWRAKAEAFLSQPGA
jgi:hypothetical protein